MMKKHTLRVPSIALEPDLAARLERYCRAVGATKTGVIVVALRAHLDLVAPQPPAKEVDGR